MLVAPASSRYSEMAREFGRCSVSGAVEPSAAPGRKRARETREAFDVKKEVFKLGQMPGKERGLLRERFQAELFAVRGLLAKAEHFLVPQAVKGGAASSSSPGLAALPGKEEGRFLMSTETDDVKAPKRRKTSPFAEHREAPKMTPAEREQLAFSLAALSAELSSHAVEFLQKQGQGHGRRGEIEVDVYSMDDAALFELKMHVDKFVKTRDPSPAPHRQIDEDDHQDEEEECVDIYGGVSPPVAAIAPSPLRLEILEYGDVFDATGLVDKLLSPLPQKYLGLAEKGEEEEEYVDICGDASPVVIQNLDAVRRSPSISPTSDSDSDSGSHSDSSDSDSSSDSGSDMDISPAPEVLPKVNGDSAPPSEPAPEVVQIAEPKKGSSPAPAVLPMVNGDSAPPSELAPGVAKIAEPEKVSSAAPAVLPKRAPEVVQSAEPEKLPDQPVASPPSARPLSELIAEAQEKRRQEERSRARQELVETERSAMTSDRVHRMEMEELGITNVEHIVSQQKRRPGVPRTLLEYLGLFLKAEDDGGEEEPVADLGIEELEEGEFRF
uniref:Uncharacterized protein n=1 Tax=Avena sativa TaxID=4498 RepID=A0ACD5ZG56_AVESA